MLPEPVPSAEAGIDGPLVLGVLLRDGTPEDLLEGDGEPLEAVQRLWAHSHTTRTAVTIAFSVAIGSNTFQPKRISWS